MTLGIQSIETLRKYYLRLERKYLVQVIRIQYIYQDITLKLAHKEGERAQIW